MSKTNSETNSTYSSEYFEQNIGNEFFGEVLNYRYFLIKKIGCGVFAWVWLAFDIYYRKLYAIKIFDKDNLKYGLEELNFLKLIKNCNEVKNLIKLNDYFIIVNNDDKYIVLVLDLYDFTLTELIHQLKNTELDLKIVNDIIMQLINALYEINNFNYIHTDIKPENVLIKWMYWKYDNIFNSIDEICIDLMIYNKIIIPFLPELKNKFLEYNVSNKLRDFYLNDFINVMKNNKNSKQINYEFRKINIWILQKMENIIKQNLLQNEVFKNMKFKIINDENEIYTDSDKSEWNEWEEWENIINYEIIMTNFKIVLADYNSIVNLNDFKYNCENEYQTRYYRSPEVILQHNITLNSDIWWIGCLIYEILTGEMLFDVYDEKYKNIRDETDNTNIKKIINDPNLFHIYLIHKQIGEIPKWFIKTIKNKDMNEVIYFNWNNEFLYKDIQIDSIEHFSITLKKWISKLNIDLEKKNKIYKLYSILIDQFFIMNNEQTFNIKNVNKLLIEISNLL